MSTPYNDKYNNYWGNQNCCPNNNNFVYSYPYTFEERNKVYLQLKQNPIIKFYKGSTITINYFINILITDEDGNVKEFNDIDFSDYEIVITYSNFRHECLFHVHKDVAETVTVDITKELSDTYFNYAGIYYCSVKFQSKDLTDPSAVKTVMLSQNEGLIYVE